MERKLTPKQEKFCHAYLETGNASEAYRSAYSTSKMKPETVSRRAKDQLRHGTISARIQELQDEFKRAHDIEKDRIMYELRAIMEAKIDDYVELVNQEVPIIIEGQLLGHKSEPVLRFKDFKDLTPLQIRAIESVKQSKYGLELKLHGKSWTIERICKIVGYEAPKRLDVKSGDKEIEGYVLVLPSNGREVIKKEGDE